MFKFSVIRTYLYVSVEVRFLVYISIAGVVRYVGPTEFGEGVWLGVELRAAKGKNDGSVQGKRYFTCKPDHGLIVRPSKVFVRGINGAKLMTDSHSPPDLTKHNSEQRVNGDSRMNGESSHHSH